MSQPLLCTLRARRLEAGLSQAELASRAGVSRQALIAIEAGRQVPSTQLALHLARVLHCAVEDLFTLAAPERITATLVPDDRSGTRVSLGRLDGTWVAHRITDGSQTADGLLIGEASGPSIVVEPLVDPHDLERNVLVAGCAPLLGILSGQLGQRTREARATWVTANSTRALDLLADGQVHLAGLHLVDTSVAGGHESLVRTRFPGRSFTLVHLTRWNQGLVVAPGNPLGIRGVDDLLRPDVRVVHRDAGSGAQALLQRLLGDRFPTLGPGPVARSHAEVARRIRYGVADVGVAIEATARAEGLGFLPLVEERFDLVVLDSRLEQAPVVQLLEQLERPGFRAEVARIPGYDASEAGHATTVSGR